MRFVLAVLAAAFCTSLAAANAQQPTPRYVSCADRAAGMRELKLSPDTPGVPIATVDAAASLIDDCTVLSFYVLTARRQPGQPIASPIFAIRRWSTEGRRDPSAAPKIDYAASTACPAVKDLLAKLEALPLPAPHFFALHPQDSISVGTDGTTYTFWANSGRYNLKIPGADIVHDITYSAWSQSPLEAFVVDLGKTLKDCWSADIPKVG